MGVDEAVNDIMNKIAIFSFISLIINLVLLGVGVYIIYLVIKALRIYIRKNS
ncbi:hypothetical protein [Oceanirhabdus sp. W0125-5]|uniref:hypothetical protein n=1 Tax=Oceanirhabdus sp. W0125-5 TaxID=2999116 RepID=UPI0022F2CB46|nr:hypothetical protein [Oceanirhabdus sp. W0125-5]WBW95973.1 hypothetical protein OW730_20105 [Oceanirhabdus sp. W0125-5]